MSEHYIFIEFLKKKWYLTLFFLLLSCEAKKLEIVSVRNNAKEGTALISSLNLDEADILAALKEFTAESLLEVSYSYKGEKQLEIKEKTEISVAKSGDYKLAVQREWEKAGEGFGSARRDAIWTGGKFFVRGRSVKFVHWEDAVMEQFEWRKERLEYLKTLLAMILRFSTISETGAPLVYEGVRAKLFILTGKKDGVTRKDASGFAGWFLNNYNPFSMDGKIIADEAAGVPLKAEISCSFKTVIGMREVEMLLKYTFSAKRAESEVKIAEPQEYLSGKRNRIVKMIREILGDDAM